MKYLNLVNSFSSNEKPEVVLTLIDLSGSMEISDMKPSRRAAAIRANREIVKVKAQQHPNDKVGVIGFQSSTKLIITPTAPRNIRNLERTIDNTVLSGGTDFVAPLKLAYKCFFAKSAGPSTNPVSKMLSSFFLEPGMNKYFSMNRADKATKRIIMLTDGEHLGDENPVHIATQLKKAGVIIDCIGIGGSPDDVDEELLKQIASRNPDGSIRYCFIGDQETLLRKYQTLAHHIRVA